MKSITDRLRMVFFGVFVIVFGIYSPKACMRAIGEVMAGGEEYDPVLIRKRHRKEFLSNYTKG